ncbi:nucleotide exchange factor GrpE [Wukongibacter sp. M2B1]|uniref:nucleotide exchange factor GrpE n=1 Tax=Wukongibacter sp. M2B1 TaxID=3088895 RepID=UPI003D794EE7
MENTVNEKDLNTQDEVESNLEATKDEIEENVKDFEALSKELEDYKNRFTRLSADFQNYKKRIEKEKSEIFKFGSEKIVTDILPVIDNFERAIQSAEGNNEESEGFFDGIQLIFKQLIDVLNKHGVEEIEAIEKEFDPNLHHAVMQDECGDVEANIITGVFQKGYTLNSKVIRPSMVKVAK